MGNSEVGISMVSGSEVFHSTLSDSTVGVSTVGNLKVDHSTLSDSTVSVSTVGNLRVDHSTLSDSTVGVSTVGNLRVDHSTLSGSTVRSQWGCLDRGVSTVVSRQSELQVPEPQSRPGPLDFLAARICEKNRRLDCSCPCRRHDRLCPYRSYFGW